MAGNLPALKSLPGGLTALALWRGAARQVRREWAGSPMHRWTLIRPRPDGLGARPRDPRPTDPAAGRMILDGRYVMGGGTLEVGRRGDPWDRPSPNRRFAQALHRFEWLPDLLTVGTEGAAEALRLQLEWARVFGRWNGFSWSQDILEYRVFNLACGIHAMASRASDVEAAQITLDLARQARHLLSAIDGPVRAAEQAVAATLAGTVLAGEAGELLVDAGLLRLERALYETVRPDGGHASRSAMAALDLLLDLQALDDALVQRGVAPPEEMMRAMDRLSGAVRFFTLSDGALPNLQGGEACPPAYVAAARCSQDSAARPPSARNGYQRLEARSLQILADAAPPSTGAWSVTACAQPLAIEILAGGRRLVSACGWTPEAQGPQAMRLVDAASSASFADMACGEPLRGFRASALGPRLVGADYEVEARRHEAPGALWLELSHNGWERRVNLRHDRRLYLDLAADELRGEDRFVPTGPEPTTPEGRRFIPFMVRFHVSPNVQASLARDGKSVLLKTEGEGNGWWLRNDAREVALESSVCFEDGQARRSQQIVLRGQARLDSGAKVRWKLAAAEAWPPPH